MLTLLASMKAILLSLLLLQGGMSTQFSSNDKFNPNPHLACVRSTTLDDAMLVVAHRTLECGTLINICHPIHKKCTEAVVADRGPYGCDKRRHKKCILYRSQIDLSTAVGKAINHNGYEEVLYIPIMDSKWEKKKRLDELKKFYLRKKSFLKRRRLT